METALQAEKDNRVTPKDVKKMYRLPDVVKFCKKCVVSNQRPRIVFGDDGVCNACKFAERKSARIDWEQRKAELKKLCDHFRSREGHYDVVIPASGGKDSTFVAYTLKEEYKMHPLTAMWAPQKFTEVGWANLQSFIHAGFDNLLGTPNGKVCRLLTRYCFREMGDPFQPFVYGMASFPLRIAVAYKIPLVFYGENGEAEYGGDNYNEDSCRYDLETEIDRHVFSNIRPDYFKKFGVSDADLQIYMPPTVDEFRKVGIEAHFMSYYRRWIPQENYYLATRYTGFTPNIDGRSEGTYSKYASLDDRMDGFHYYLMFIKFGIGRATSDAAHEIRDGHLNRDEGLRLVRKYDGEFPRKYFKEFLEYCDITEEYFWEVINSWRSPHIWEKSSGEWKLRYQVT